MLFAAWHFLPLEIAMLEMEVLYPVSVLADAFGCQFLLVVVDRQQWFVISPCCE